MLCISFVDLLPQSMQVQPGPMSWHAMPHILDAAL